MNLWELLKKPLPNLSKKKGIWGELISKTDLSGYVPHKTGLIEEKKIESKRSGDYFVVKNQNQVRYLKLTPQDYFLWQKIDGKTSFSDLVMSYFKQFGSFAFNRIHSLVNQLRSNYFLEEKPVRLFSRLAQLSEAHTFSAKMTRLVRAFMQKEVPFAHLDQWVTRFYNAFFWLFFTRIAKWSYVALTLLGFGCFGYFLHTGQYTIVQMQGSYLMGVLILVSLQVFIILLHEGAHAFAAKSYGRQVPRGGFMLYMGMPAFFVDTTDMWLENKKKRIAVSWAGPYSELIVGGLFGLYMLLFPESAANPILFKCMFLFYFGVFLNMNPLLELDGYYILVDLLEIPMLRRRSFDFVRKGLLKKIKEREPFSTGEKIFTVFGVLAGAYTLFAVTVALYFWQTRIFDSVLDLWGKGLGSQIVVCLLVLASLGPIVLFLALKLIKLVRWVWEQVLSNPIFKEVNKGGPVVTALLLLFLFAGWNQPWVSVDWLEKGVGLLFILTLAHFLYWHAEKFFFTLFGSKLFYWPAALLVASALSLYFSIFAAEIMLFAALLNFVLALRTLLETKITVSFPAAPSDEEKLESTFFGWLAYLEKSLPLFFSAARSKKIFARIKTVSDEIPKQKSGILEKANAVSRAFDLGQQKINRLLGRYWAGELLTRFVDSLDWQEREIWEQCLGKKWQTNIHSLEAILKANFLFGDLSPAEIAQLAKVFKQESFRPKEKIIRQGEAGDKFYLIKKGIVSVLIQNKEGIETEVALLHEGDFFGEIALLKEIPRTATCVAVNDVSVWSLDKPSFSRYVKERFSVSISIERAIEILRLISAMPLFKELSPTQKRELASSFSTRKMAAGKNVITQGEQGSEFFVIEKGECAVKIKALDGVEKEVAKLGKGEYFGEIALLSDAPRSATIQAAAETELLVLSKEKFDEMIQSSLASSGSLEKVSSRRRLDTQKKTKLSIAEVS